MSLYDGILNNEGPNDWQKSANSSIKLLQAHLQVKRAAQQANATKARKPNFLASSSKNFPSECLTHPPVIRSLSFNKSISVLEGDWNIEEEYDPSWPNDYEKLKKEKSQQAETKNNARSNDNAQVIATKSLGLDYDDDDEEGESDRWTERVQRPNAAIAPPLSLVENIEPSTKTQGSVGFGVSSVAAKIMAKMGYREGQGLGRDEQGISKALQIEKTGKTQGKIIIETDRKPEESTSLESSKCPSRIVLLRNMVGPGEVDDDLQSETKAECERFGEITRCLVHEFDDFESEEDAVWIFIEFKSVDSSHQALKELNNRYFGGRIVKASFYEENEFKNFISSNTETK